MSIAVLTVATGGIGLEFVKSLIKENFDEIWCIARNKKAETSLDILFDLFETNLLEEEAVKAGPEKLTFSPYGIKTIKTKL